MLTEDGRLALLDLGMVARVAPDMRDQLLKLLLAVAEGNGADTAEVIAALCDRRDDVEFDRTTFRRGVANLVADQQGVTLERTSGGAWSPG